MSESIRKIDARGLPCPEPVIATKKALEAGGYELLEIMVDGPTAKENVTRFAAHSGHAIDGVRDEGAVSTIRIRYKTEGAVMAAPTSGTAKRHEGSAVSTVLIASDTIGSGDAELGALLMRGFISTLIEASKLPERLIFMNGGVRLAVEGSASLGNLSQLSALGVEILACGTCLDFYKVKDKLAVGRTSNMFEISEILLRGSTLSL